MSTSYGSDVILGERYRDPQTGLEGVATCVHFYQFACERVTLELVSAKTDELQELTFDAPRLVHVGTDQPVTVDRTGGPARAGERRDVPGFRGVRR